MQTLEAIEKQASLINSYENVKIEAIGSWLWVSGETKEHKEELKNLGFKWSKNKSAWYWYENINKKAHYRGRCNSVEECKKYHTFKVLKDIKEEK